MTQALRPLHVSVRPVGSFSLKARLSVGRGNAARPARAATFLIVASVLMSWAPVAGPFQVIGYAIPPMVLVLGLLFRVVSVSRYEALLLTVLALISSISTIPSTAETPLLHIGLGLFTHLPLLLLAVRFKDGGDSLMPTFLTALAWVSIVEAAIGM